ncbi:MAG TPA: DUF2939 domain-containing protein [Caulobacteraceae bacterium]|nr:DUF2939 domain-containing protein [Caulobacteraceae bacterium]
MNRTSVLWIAGAAGVLIFLAAWFGSPYAALGKLSAVARAGDRDRLNELVDFPAVRANLKEQLSAGMLRSVRDDAGAKENPLAALGLLIAPAIIDRAIDAYATPDAIAAMVAKAPAPGHLAAVGGGGESEPPPRKMRVSYSWAGLDRFRAQVTDPDQAARPFGFVFERQGLFGWRLERIDLPLRSSRIEAETAPADTAARAPPMGNDCSNTRVSQVGSRLEGMPDSGSAIQYENGKSQVSYDTVPGIADARVGDRVRLCLVSRPQNCPPGDDRGAVWRATDLRNGETWSEADSEHSCGGA